MEQKSKAKFQQNKNDCATAEKKIEKKCFVIMPFGRGEGAEYSRGERESNFIFEKIISPAVKRASEKIWGSMKIKVFRDLEEFIPGRITTGVIQEIAEADLLIADITGNNANVFLELGVRYSLYRNGTILMTQDISQIPFNVFGMRVVEYEPELDGIEKARHDLEAAVEATLRLMEHPVFFSPGLTDSPVFERFPSLNVNFPKQKPGWVSWDEYWTKIESVIKILTELAPDYYEPDALVSVSNGGLLFADSVSRLAYENRIPLFSLWANRKDYLDLFANPVSKGILEQLRKMVSDHHHSKGETTDHRGKLKKKAFQVLFLDDMVGGGNTFQQFLKYFNDLIEKEAMEIHFLVLYTSNKEAIKRFRPNFLFCSDDSDISKVFAGFEVMTNRHTLPYRKEIPHGGIVEDG